MKPICSTEIGSNASFHMWIETKYDVPTTLRSGCLIVEE